MACSSTAPTLGAGLARRVGGGGLALGANPIGPGTSIADNDMFKAMKASPEAMQRSLEQDVKMWAEVVKATGVKLQ